MIFDRFRGVLEEVKGEGTHIIIPFVQTPIIMDIRARPRVINSVTGTKDLQVEPFANSSPGYSNLTLEPCVDGQHITACALSAF